MARIMLENVTRRFGPVIAVDNVSLPIIDGEFFALLGPSGCGKTTTLRLIAGLEVPTAGRVHIGDRDVTGLPPRERDVAMVFQDYALYPHMTILDNVGYPLKVRGVGRREIRERVGEVAGFLQIAELLERRPAQLSGGQQQRAAVARAVVHKPQVFLFDEPLSNLDAKLRLEARGFLKHLQHELGITTVYVTHDQAEALALADRIAIMNQGRIIQVGTPLEVYRRPQTTFVAGFIGSPPMNLVPCHMEIGVEAAHLVGTTFRLDLTSLRDRLALTFRDGEEVILGIRPEHLTLCGQGDPFAIPAETYAIQPLGAECVVILLVDNTTISVRLFTGEPPQPAGRVWVALNPERILVYRKSGELVSG
ncbi:MAG: ABC transporter ATP-binding protein [Chloroflexota bacterium]